MSCFPGRQPCLMSTPLKSMPRGRLGPAVPGTGRGVWPRGSQTVTFLTPSLCPARWAAILPGTPLTARSGPSRSHFFTYPRGWRFYTFNRSDCPVILPDAPTEPGTGKCTHPAIVTATAVVIGNMALREGTGPGLCVLGLLSPGPVGRNPVPPNSWPWAVHTGKAVPRPAGCGSHELPVGGGERRVSPGPGHFHGERGGARLLPGPALWPRCLSSRVPLCLCAEPGL